MQLQPDTLLQGGKYKIKSVLGQGGFGITYLGWQDELNRYVATAMKPLHKFLWEP